MSYPVIERPIEAGTLERPSGMPGSLFRANAQGAAFEPADVISRLAQTQTMNIGGLSGSPLSLLFPGLGGLFGGSGIASLMQQLLSALQNFFGGANAGGGDEQYFQKANGASVGDPHLSFNGSTWDNMGPQPDLLHSDSFQGGYQLSTQTTAPQANGVTYNQCATVATNYGATRVSLDNGGNATVSENGNSYSLSPGQTMDLGNGEIVQRDADGSLHVSCDNGNGGQITTTMRVIGSGVDVSTNANNVDLGGALVQGSNDQGGTTMTPFQRRGPLTIA